MAIRPIYVEEKSEKINYNIRNRGWEFSYSDLKFKKVPIKHKTSQGFEYNRLKSVGMPKIPLQLLDSTFYLYKNREDAEKGKNFGGTGFFVTVPSEKYLDEIIYIYGISNWHVVLAGGCSVIRVNTLDGNVDIIEYEPTEWEWIPSKDDIAISPLLSVLNPIRHSSNLISAEYFATDEIVKQYGINVGDDIFMLGRFMDHDGGIINLPAARFGNISVMPTEIKQPTGYMGKSYCIDAHSRTGFSGSPVFVYRTIGSDLNEAHQTGWPSFSGFCYLLGIHWGQFPEEWEVKEIKLNEKRAFFESRSIITEGAYIEGYSGMTCVIPAQKIMDLINLPEVKKERNKGDEMYGTKRRKTGHSPKAELGAVNPNTDNPQHKEDFNSLVSAAAKKKPQDD